MMPKKKVRRGPLIDLLLFLKVANIFFILYTYSIEVINTHHTHNRYDIIEWEGGGNTFIYHNRSLHAKDV